MIAEEGLHVALTGQSRGKRGGIERILAQADTRTGLELIRDGNNAITLDVKIAVGTESRVVADDGRSVEIQRTAGVVDTAAVAACARHVAGDGTAAEGQGAVRPDTAAVEADVLDRIIRDRAAAHRHLAAVQNTRAAELIGGVGGN